MNETFSVTYSTPDDRKGVVAEIWAGNEQVAEIHDDQGYFAIEFYAREAGEPWRFKLEDITGIISSAVNGLQKKKR